jgi:hypothetical protein
MRSAVVPNLQQEHAHLVLADRHLVEGEQRVAEQIALIERMTQLGHDTAVAKQFLRILEQTLEGWRAHRQLIVNAIEQK